MKCARPPPERTYTRDEKDPGARATTIHAPFDIRVEDVSEPVVRLPTDAVVRVLRARICGSDLWAYRGEAARQPGPEVSPGP